MLKQHHDQVAKSEAELTVATEETRQLRRKVSEDSLQAVTDSEQIKALKEALSKERSTSEYLRARMQYFERKHRRAAVYDEVLRAERDRLQDEVADDQGASEQKAKALKDAKRHIAALKKNTKRAVQVFIFLQDGQRTLTTWYDVDVYFRTVLEDYAQETDQDSSLLTGCFYGSTEEIELDEVFVIQANQKRRAWLVRIEVTDGPPAKRRRTWYAGSSATGSKGTFGW